jgi:uncharacterized protein (DUF1697 family)
VTDRTYVGFVRGVMIGREGLHRQVLLDMFERAGATVPVSYITTGNVSFSIDPGELGRVIDQVETDLARLLGRDTPVFVRSLDELVELLDADPFADEPFEAVYARLVTFFRNSVPAALTAPLRAPNDDWEVFATGPGEVFSVTRAWPDRQPSDPGGVIQRLAGEPTTTRAIGTLERIVTRLRP